MPRSDRATDDGDVVLFRHERQEERWSPPHTAMLVTLSSVLLWALIIGALTWLL